MVPEIPVRQNEISRRETIVKGLMMEFLRTCINRVCDFQLTTINTGFFVGRA